MFENSFFTRSNLRCRYHCNNKITHICTRSICDKSPLLCQQCMNSKLKEQHYGHQYEIEFVDNYLETIAHSITREKPSIQRLYKLIMSQNQNSILLNWQKQKQQHFQSIQNHLNTLKFQMDEQISNIVIRFEEQLNKEKENIQKQLTAYFETYKNKFNNFAELTEPIMLMQQSYIYYQSKNNLCLKLMSLEPNKLSKWLNGLKFNFNRAELAVKKEIEYINRVQNLGIVTNQLMDELPRYKNLDFQNQLPRLLKQSSKNILSSLVSFRRNRVIGVQNSIIPLEEPSNIIRSTSMNYLPLDHNRSISGNQASRDSSRLKRKGEMP